MLYLESQEHYQWVFISYITPKYRKCGTLFICYRIFWFFFPLAFRAAESMSSLGRPLLKLNLMYRKPAYRQRYHLIGTWISSSFVFLTNVRRDFCPFPPPRTSSHYTERAATRRPLRTIVRFITARSLHVRGQHGKFQPDFSIPFSIWGRTFQLECFTAKVENVHSLALSTSPWRRYTRSAFMLSNLLFYCVTWFPSETAHFILLNYSQNSWLKLWSINRSYAWIL